VTTLAEAIVSEHAEVESVEPGQLVTTSVDRVYLQDGNTPTVRRLFRENGFDRVFDPDRIGVFFDHSVLTPDTQMADRLVEAEEFAEGLGLRVYGRGEGISHVIAVEEHWFEPGAIVVGADSHTCTGGVVQCLALGMGASDVVAAMVTGRTWLRVPETVWIRVAGFPGRFAGAKDVMLYALARLGQRPFLYRSVEWVGPWVETLSVDGASTVANLGVEFGAKCSFLPPGPGRRDGLRAIDAPADGDCVLELDVEGLPPHVARPHSPLDGVPLEECAGQEIDYVFVGSCANSRFEDLAEVASVLAHAQVSPRVHLVVTPGSKRVYLRALAEGIVETLAQAGALVTPPGCGACVGTQGTIPATGQRVLTTMNRNFRGRMGNPGAEIWLSSPVVAAHTAVLGRIPAPEDLG
jgi:3-isopropylmalate/(R)-2-methylmalate dehydratase large subunit